MVRVFLDTNVILDYLLERQDFADDAEIVLNYYRDGRFAYLMSSVSMVNIAYITRKVFQGDDLYNQLEMVREFADVTSVDQKCIDEAIGMRHQDYEDAVQYMSAKISGADVIVTRNKKHFPDSDLRILSPKEFIEEFIC